jgi:hypothetical protein
VISEVSSNLFSVGSEEELVRRLQMKYTKVYPKVSGLAAWSENCEWYSSLPLGAVVSLFFESVY